MHNPYSDRYTFTLQLDTPSGQRYAQSLVTTDELANIDEDHMGTYEGVARAMRELMERFYSENRTYRRNARASDFTGEIGSMYGVRFLENLEPNPLLQGFAGGSTLPYAGTSTLTPSALSQALDNNIREVLNTDRPT